MQCSSAYWQEWINYIKKLEKETEDDAITKEKNCELYDILCEKHNKGIYMKRPNFSRCEMNDGKNIFEPGKCRKQKSVLMAIFNCSKIGVVEANLELIKQSAHTGKMLINKNITEAKEFKLVYQSVTGHL